MGRQKRVLGAALLCPSAVTTPWWLRGPAVPVRRDLFLSGAGPATGHQNLWVNAPCDVLYSVPMLKLIGCWQFNAIGRPVLSSPSAARPLLPPLTPDRSSRRWLASTLVALRTPGSSRNQTGYSWLRLFFDEFFRISRRHVAPHTSCDVFFLVPMLDGG